MCCFIQEIAATATPLMLRYNRYRGKEFTVRAARVFLGCCCRCIILLALAIKKQLDTTPQESGQQVTFDLHPAHYVDHTVMENLHNYKRDFQLAGG